MIERSLTRLLVVLMFTGCASKPIEPLPEGTEMSAAVGSVVFWRWAGRAVLQLITNTTVNIEVKEESK